MTASLLLCDTAERKANELAIARRIARVPRQERAEVWKKETGKSEKGLYRRLEDLTNGTGAGGVVTAASPASLFFVSPVRRHRVIAASRPCPGPARQLAVSLGEDNLLADRLLTRYHPLPCSTLLGIPKKNRNKDKPLPGKVYLLGGRLQRWKTTEHARLKITGSGTEGVKWSRPFHFPDRRRRCRELARWLADRAGRVDTPRPNLLKGRGLGKIRICIDK
jgi:hypothetical protein